MHMCSAAKRRNGTGMPVPAGSATQTEVPRCGDGFVNFKTLLSPLRGYLNLVRAQSVNGRPRLPSFALPVCLPEKINLLPLA